MRHVYLSGPMSGLPQHNIPAFRIAAANLRIERELKVYNPAEEHGAEYISREGTPIRYAYCIGQDVAMITRGVFDAVVVLSGWDRSAGALLETAAARLRGIPVLEYMPGNGPLYPVNEHVLKNAHRRMEAR